MAQDSRSGDGIDPEDPGSARDPLPLPPRREAFILGWGVVALGLGYFHGSLPGVEPRFRLLGWMLVNVVVCFVVPAAVIRFGWRESLADYGFRLGRARVWLRDCAVLLVVMVPVVAIASRTEAFHAYYPRFDLARHSAGWWAVSAFGWLLYFMAWEWFFRGFMLFGLAPRLGPGLAIMVQMVPFAMSHFSKLETEAWASVLAGLALGVMAWRGRSFLGPWALHWLVATAMDLLVILWPLQQTLR